MEYEREQQMEYDTRPVRKCFSRLGLAYVVYVVVSALSQLAVVFLIEEPQGRLEWNLWMMTVTLSMYPLAFLLFYLILRNMPKATQTWKEPMTAGRYLGIFVVCMGVTYIGNFIGQILMWFAGLVLGEPIYNDLNFLLDSMDPWLILLVVVIAAPIMEELIFRKMLLDRIAGYGQITSLLMSGLIFGLAHGNFYQFFYAFALGTIFAHVYLRTGKVIYTIGLHMLINFCGSFLTLYLVDIITGSEVMGILVALTELMVIFALMGLAIFLLIYYRNEILLYSGPPKTSKKKWFFAVIVNVGMILYLLLTASLFFFA